MKYSLEHARDAELGSGISTIKLWEHFGWSEFIDKLIFKAVYTSGAGNKMPWQIKMLVYMRPHLARIQDNGIALFVLCILYYLPFSLQERLQSGSPNTVRHGGFLLALALNCLDSYAKDGIDVGFDVIEILVAAGISIDQVEFD
jgi:hypothetical protein